MAVRALSRFVFPPIHNRYLYHIVTRSITNILLDSVVKISVVSESRDVEMPWIVFQERSSGSGFCIRNKTIVTNNHVVAGAVTILVKKNNTDRPYYGKILHLIPYADLALLTVCSASFWKDIIPLSLGDLPTLTTTVFIVGYPLDWSSISITKGTVSAILGRSETFRQTNLIDIFVDALVNCGNSGGPAFTEDGKVVGIVYCKVNIEIAEGVGLLIPTNILSYVLEDLKQNGQFSGFTALDISYQRLLNIYLRESLNLQPHHGGVMVLHDLLLLKRQDVILYVDDIFIGADGLVNLQAGQRILFSYLFTMIKLGEKTKIEILRDVNLQAGQRILFSYLFTMIKLGEKTKIEILRDGKSQTLFMELDRRHASTRPQPPPSFFTICGFVFQNIEEKVVLSGIIHNWQNIHYDDRLKSAEVDRFNGEPIRNLLSMFIKIRICNEKFLIFDFKDGQKIALDREKALSLPFLYSNDLQRNKFVDEGKTLMEQISKLKALLASKAQIYQNKFSTPRRSWLEDTDCGQLDEIDVIPNEEMLLAFSEKGYVKRMKPNTFNLQNRGTIGKSVGKLRGNDVMSNFLVCHAHDHVLYFSDKGIVFSARAYKIPECNRAAAGTPLIQILSLSDGELITSIFPVSEFAGDQYLLMITAKGYIKKISLNYFSSIRSTGIIAIQLVPGDELKWVRLCTNDDLVAMASHNGMVILTSCDVIRSLGRNTRGSVAMRLKQGDKMASMDIIPALTSKDSTLETDPESARNNSGPWLLFVSESGYGKRVPLSSFRKSPLNRVGLRGYKFALEDKLAAVFVVGFSSADDGESDEEVVLLSQSGTVNRIKVRDISIQSRHTRGVILMRLEYGGKIQSASLISATESVPDEADLTEDSCQIA